MKHRSETSQQDDTRPRKTAPSFIFPLGRWSRVISRMQSFASLLRDAVTAVEDTWRVNIRGVGSLKKRGTSSGPRSFVKSSPACSLFESLIKEVAVSRLIFYGRSPLLSSVLSRFSFLLIFIFFYRNLRYLNKNSKIYLRLLLKLRYEFFYNKNT